MRRRSERCAPSVLVALTATPGGTTRRTRAAARSWAVTTWSRVARSSRTGRAARRERALHDTGREREQDEPADDRGSRSGPSALQPGGAEDRRRDEPRDRGGRVVEVDRRLRPRGGEEVEGQVGQGARRHERREERQPSEGHEEIEEVGEVTVLGRRLEHAQRVTDKGLGPFPRASRRRRHSGPRTAILRPGRSAGR